MRNRQIEKTSRGLFIITNVLAVCSLLLSAVVCPDLPAHVPIHTDFWGEGNSFGPESNMSMWPVVLSGLNIHQRSYQPVQLYGRWLKVLSIIVNFGALPGILRLFIHLLI